jgi:hypothetical protein
MNFKDCLAAPPPAVTEEWKNDASIRIHVLETALRRKEESKKTWFL